MSKKVREIGIHKLYKQDPVEADKLVWGREVDPVSRRGFLRKSSLLAMTAAVGANIPYADKMLGGLIPAAFANTELPFSIEGKKGLRILNDKPINAETPPHLLDDEFTPAKYFFVRNNGIPPAKISVGDINNWMLEISGESCQRPQSFSISDLKQRFKHHTYALTLECAGNGRREFDPPAKGNPVVYRCGRLCKMDRC